MTLIVLVLTFNSCRKEVDIELKADFEYSIVDDDYNVPVRINFRNTSTGALFYHWTFPGGSPSESDNRDPGQIIFSKPGEIEVRLIARNDVDSVEKILHLILDTVPKANFTSTPRINNFTPVDWDFQFTGEGATVFDWQFENGVPASSKIRNPQGIHYETPGNYRVTLRVANARGKFDTVSKYITVLPPLEADFEIVPSFDDDDFQAPFKAALVSHSTSANTHLWESQGGTINNSHDSIAEINYSNPGTYTVKYTASNGKQTKAITKTITVFPNSGYRFFENVQLGINTASSRAKYFSTKLRKTIWSDSITIANGSLIDLCFFGLNASFVFNKFISPTDTQNWTFSAIPGARSVSIVNNLSTCNCGISLTSSDFDAIDSGDDLAGLNVPNSVSGQFNNAEVPRVVVFMNADGKKGAIKIKDFVVNGFESYIVCDIKIQKD